MSIRKELVRIAHRHPELRADLLPLIRKTAQLDGADLAILELSQEANLPVRIQEAKSAKYPVPVPRGFESLFEKVFLEVVAMRSDHPSYVVKWKYDHADGGYNSYPIGQVIFDTTKNQWAWRTTSGRYGYV